MTCTALIKRVEEGRKRRDRLEVEIETERRGRPMQMDCHLWLNSPHDAWMGSLLIAKRDSQEPVELTMEASFYGYRIRQALALEGSPT